jgi:hypothetical protein
VTDTQDKLAALRRKTLERNDEIDPDGRVYIDKQTGQVYHSVTRILGATMPAKNREALDKWLERPGSYQNREMAATRGTATHNSAEYCLKTAQRLARSTANKRNSWKMGEDGLYRAPKAVTSWALEKAIAGSPKVNWSASGFARGLRGWILDHVTAIHAVEFSGYHPLGFAGSCDALVDLGGTGPVIVDWKTSGKSLHSDMESSLVQYRDQTGAYAMMLEHLTGIRAKAGAVVVARRSGEPVCTLLNREELDEAEERFKARCAQYFLTEA